MEDFTECQRRLRAVDGDLVSMRALYLDETSAHSETKAAFEEAKGEWDAAREGDLARIKELEGVAEAKRAVEGDLAAAKETIQALGTTIQVRGRTSSTTGAGAPMIALIIISLGSGRHATHQNIHKSFYYVSIIWICYNRTAVVLMISAPAAVHQMRG